MPDIRASAQYADLVKIYFLGTGSGVTDHFVLDGSEWHQERRPAGSVDNEAIAADLFLVEIRDTDPASSRLEDCLKDLVSQRYLAGSILVGKRSTAREVERIVAASEGWKATVLGVDPDYFFGLVPLEAPGHRWIEAFVQRLKPANTTKERLGRTIKRLLILAGFSSSLYESFVVVLEKTECC